MPWSEIAEGMSLEMADALCSELPLSSDSKQMKRWDLCCKYGGDGIALWLATEPEVDNVKFNGKVWCMRGMPAPRIKARACFLTLEVKHSPASTCSYFRLLARIAGILVSAQCALLLLAPTLLSL